MKVRPARVLLVLVGSLASVALVGWAFYRPTRTDGAWRFEPRFAFDEWLTHLPSHLPWVLPFIVLAGTLSALRALVWRHALPEPAPRWRARFHALAMGGLVHNAAPGRLGPLVSGWVLSRASGIPVSAAFSSLLLAKLLEFGALVAAVAVLAAVAEARGLGDGAATGPLLMGGFVALLLFTGALAAARRFAPTLAASLTRRRRLPRLAAILVAIASGLAAVRSPPRLAAGLAISLLPVLAQAFGYGLALRHLGVEQFLLGGGLLVGAITLGQFTPGLPIGVGVYYFVCSTTARALGASDQGAAALAVLSHAAVTISHLLVGLGSALAYHQGLRDLFRLRAAVTAARAPKLMSP